MSFMSVFSFTKQRLQLRLPLSLDALSRLRSLLVLPAMGNFIEAVK